MKKTKLKTQTLEQLLERFVAIGLEQEQALLFSDIREFNRLYTQMQEVVAELRSREGDQRRVLRSLYDHPNLQVRLKAVKNSLALAPQDGRRVLQAIADSGRHPPAGEAGMSLDRLDEGIFRPK